ncbi:MAG: type II secretion system protein [Verrucomicrobia bacterium]|jgi:type II secretory pathway pseudopilin PulG|nr:MAG: type II secretion system protein [Verrucomicrobiota bacterium]
MRGALIIHPAKRRQSGYLLLEVVLAMGLFALAATGFTRALQSAADASDMAAREMQVTRILQSSLDEALSLPVLEEGETTEDLEEREMRIVTNFERIEDLENQQGQLLQDMWRITVTAYFRQGTVELTRSATTWRYGRLYQP